MKQGKTLFVLLLLCILLTQTLARRRKYKGSNHNDLLYRKTPIYPTYYRDRSLNGLDNEEPLGLTKETPKKSSAAKAQTQKKNIKKNKKKEEELNSDSLLLPESPFKTKRKVSAANNVESVDNVLPPLESNATSSGSENSSMFFIAIIIGAIVAVLGIFGTIVYFIKKKISSNRRKLRYMESLRNSTYTKRGDGLDEFREILE